MAQYRYPFDEYNVGYFFVTVCVKDRRHLLGNISGETMHLSPLGERTVDCIEYAKSHYDGVDIPVFTVMPNHFHMILCIDKCYDEPNNQNLGALRPKMHPEMDGETVFHHNSRFSIVLRSIKGAVTRYANAHGMHLEWQQRGNDRVIRNQRELNHISDYIENNVIRWATDRFNNTAPTITDPFDVE